MTVDIRIGDSLELLRAMPDQSVHCCVTSPPYWGLRDYGINGQLGQEKTLGEHVAVMTAIFEEVRRVLRDDGTLWLNYGDSYATSPNGKAAADYKADGSDDRTFRDKPFSTIGPVYDPEGGSKGGGFRGNNKGNGEPAPNGRIVSGGYLKPKDLCGIPWRVAFALQDAGWYLRQDIIWHKPNPMPESIKDRCTKAHEYLFLMAKSKRYYFDQEAILEDSSPNTHARQANNGYKMPDGWDTGEGAHGSIHRQGREKGAKAAARRGGGNRSHKGTQAYEDGQLEHRTKEGLVKFSEKQRKLATSWKGSEFHTGKTGEHQLGRSQQNRVKNNESFDEAMAIMPEKRNKRSVWTVATAPFKEAHFATFPPDLIIPCILAGCPKGGLVLDPFGGAGTTGLVADRLQRNAILLELNPAYAEMARQRIDGDAPLFAEATP